MLELLVGAVAHGGHCVARHEGRVVFVRHALPGERVLARLTEAGPAERFWRADAIEVLRASPDRVEPACPLSGPVAPDGSGGCGGCDWQHASVAAQRRLKAAVVTEQLARLGRVDLAAAGLDAVEVRAVRGDIEGLGWRTRVRFAVDGLGRAGLRRHRGHEVVPVPHCPIAHPGIDELGIGRRSWPGINGVEVVVGGAGVVSGGVVSGGVVSGGVVSGGVVSGGVVSDGTGSDRTGSDRTAAGVVSGDVGGVQRLLVVEPEPAGPMDTRPDHRRRSSRPGRGARPGVADLPPLGAESSVARRGPDGLQRIRGRTWVEESVLVDGVRRTFRVTGAGFWQIHPGAAQTLLDTVLAMARPQLGESGLDLYCGVGLFAAGLALRVGESGHVLGVEGDPRAAADARRSLHDLATVRLETGGAEPVLRRLAASGQLRRPDVVVLDPPRSGAGRAVVEAVTALRPRVVVYVACDPAALARDVATAARSGYRLDGLAAFDTFPMTHHVECVARLTPTSP